MPQIKCPKCGRVRVVVEGKRKNCRRCGTPLSANMPKPKPPEKVTSKIICERFPEQVAEIREQAKAEVVLEEIGEPTVDLLLEHYPELVEEITAAAREDARKETLDELKKKRAEKKAAAKAKKS